MAKDPDQRYQTAAELAHAARTALDRPTLPPQPPTQLAATRLARPPAPPDRDAHQRARRRRTWIITGLVNLVVVAVAAAVSVAVLANRDSSEATASGPTSGTTTSSSQLPPLNPSPQLGADCQYPPSAEPASKSVNPPRSGNVSTEPAQVSVGMMTDQGPIGLMLDNARSPCTVNSFISLAGQKFFDNTQCHRLTTAPTLHVLQCGDPAGNGSGGPGYEFANEYPTTQHQPDDPALDTPISYPRGTLAMANAGPDTNGSQFFLVYADSQLPPLYTIFGTIQSDGLATLDKIAAAGVEGGGDDGAPAAPVTITSIRMD